ncbi:transmembrane protease serine 3-like isoform X2 [Apostichopus japonicus]|uniref:transmembrane protease serine 3-like isoform X2 n=1 Tax=Stichopus japonicus TaxID=307972 RepID=UPI003AB7C9E6
MPAGMACCTYSLLVLITWGVFCYIVAHAQFSCFDDVIIATDDVCDYKWDCPSGEDESDCRYLESLPYPDNQHMVWTVKASVGLILALSTEGPFDIEEKYDALAVGHGTRPSTESQLLTYSGSQGPSPFVTYNREIWIRFQSDGDKNGVGFSVKVLALNATDTLRCDKGDIIRPNEVCNLKWDCPDGRDESNCDPILPESPYIVISPFDLTGYSNNLDVFWTARTLIGWTFRLQFLSFETEPIFDLLQVGAGLECNHVFDYSFSGSEVPDVITTKDNTLCLHFSSDYSVVSRGFSVNISTIEIPVTPQICGDRPAEGVNSRIIGGNDASLGNWPWIGSIRTSSGKYLCSASLIHPEWAVTARHCIGQGGHEVVFGDILLSESSPYQQRVTFTPSGHPDFSYATLQHDIALLHLNRSVNVTDYVRPVCLAEFENETSIYEECLIAGWGVKDLRSESASDKLQEAEVPIIDGTTCSNYLGDLFYPSIMICAGFHDGGVDSCNGDSGGPLMCRNSDGRWDLVGVTSFGIFCAFPELPGIYTRISAHLQFISEHISNLPD